MGAEVALRRIRLAPVALAAVFAACTDSKLKLSAFDPSDRTAPVTTADPPGGSFREIPATVRLESDEPATIHYTIDGSEPTTASPAEASPIALTGLADGTTVRFFAIDPNGNEEAPSSATYSVDVSGPAAVGAFTLAMTGSDASLAWTNPVDPDFAGVILAVSSGALAAPVDGTTYEVDGEIASGTRVVFTGSGTSLDEPDLPPGIHRWGVWAYDSLRNYSPIRVAQANVAIPLQRATVAVDVAALSTTIPVPTSTLVLSAGTPTYVAGTMILSVPLTVTNMASRPVHNPKVVVRSVGGGTFSNADAGTVEGDAQRYFGSGLAPGESASRTLTFSGVAATATVSLDVDVVDSPFTLFPSWGCAFSGGAADAATGALAGPLEHSVASEGTNGNCSSWMSAVLSADGRFLFAGARQAPRIDRIDLVTLAPVGGVSLSFAEAKASIGAVALDHSGRTLYAILHDGNCANPRSSNAVRDVAAYLVRLDAATLAETGRLRLAVPFDDGVRARRMALSPDGTTLAIPSSTRRTPRHGSRSWTSRRSPRGTWTRARTASSPSPPRPRSVRRRWSSRRTAPCSTRTTHGRSAGTTSRSSRSPTCPSRASPLPTRPRLPSRRTDGCSSAATPASASACTSRSSASRVR